MNRRLSILLCLALYAPLSSQAQSIDNFRLANGVNCYVVESQSPTFDYYFIQNSGNAADSEDQLGQSHLVEHLSFVSTDHFANSGAASFLKRHQINSNASTYQDKIIYYLKGIAAQDRLLNDSCLLLLRDWCGDQQVNEQELRHEIGIITEEWRSGERFVGARAEYARLLYNNSPYSRISGLGNIDELGQLTTTQIRDFIERRFDPRSCAIVVSGPVAQWGGLKGRLDSLFGDLKPYPRHVAVDFVTIADNDSLYFQQIATADAMPAIVTVNMRTVDNTRLDTDGFCRDILYAQIYNYFIERRLARYTASPESRIYGFKVNYAELVRGYKQLHMEVTTFPGFELREFRAALGLHRDLVANGLTQGEREELIAAFEYGFTTPEAITDGVIAAQNNFLRSYPIVAPDIYREVARKAVMEFSQEDFRGFCGRITSDKNVLVVAQNPKRYDRVITYKALRDAVRDTATLGFDGQARSIDIGSLLDSPKKRVGAAKPIAEFGGSLWHLANGACVVYRPTADKRVSIEGYRAGGLAWLQSLEVAAASAIVPMSDMLGAGGYSGLDIDNFKFANGIVMSRSFGRFMCRSSISAPIERTQQVAGLIALVAGENRFEVLNEVDKQRGGFNLALENSQNQDQYRVMFESELLGIKPVVGSSSPSYLKDVTSDKLAAMNARSFGNARGWLYIVSGDLSQGQIDLLLKTIASLPSSSREKLEVMPMKIVPTQSVVKEVIYNTPDDNGGTDMSLVLAQPLSESEQASFHILSRMLRNRIYVTMREQRAVIYGMYTAIRSELYPLPLNVININFGSRKGEQEPIAEFIHQQIAQMAAQGVSAAEMATALDFVAASLSDASSFEQRCAGLWLSGQGEKLTAIKHADTRQITPEQVRAIAKRLVDQGLTIRFVFK